VITIHQRYRQTDRQTTCDRNTALCTKVHRAVKSVRKRIGEKYTPTDKLFCLWANQENMEKFS